jgi:hypothetical protein
VILVTQVRRAKVEKESLTVAIGKLAIAGEQAGFTVEHTIQLLNSGLTVETLIELIAWRLERVPTRLAPYAAPSCWIV